MSALKAERFAPGAYTQIRRRKARAREDADFMLRVIAEALICHVAFVARGRPLCLPMAHARVDDVVYLHGALNNELLCSLDKSPCTLTFTLVDGLVFGRSAFHHSMNYRSVAALGVGRRVTSADEKCRALLALVNHAAPGRANECVPPSDSELQGTHVLAVEIDEAVGKQRSGPPIDDAEHCADPTLWGGVVPLGVRAQPTLRDTALPQGLVQPPSIAALSERLGVPAPVEMQWQGWLLSSDPARIDEAWVHRMLSEDSYWAAGVSRSSLHTSLQNSTVFGAYLEGKQRAFARVLSDGARVGYLADVYVDPAQRGLGVGKELVRFALAHPAVHRLERVLLGTRDAHGLYQRFGFEVAPPGISMVRRNRVPD
jgi:uncharacterized protein